MSAFTFDALSSLPIILLLVKQNCEFRTFHIVVYTVYFYSSKASLCVKLRKKYIKLFPYYKNVNQHSCDFKCSFNSWYHSSSWKTVVTLAQDAVVKLISFLYLTQLFTNAYCILIILLICALFFFVKKGTVVKALKLRSHIKTLSMSIWTILALAETENEIYLSLSF